MGDSNIHVKDKEPRHVEIKMHKRRRFAPEQPPAPKGVGSRFGIQQQSSHFFVRRNIEREICVTKKGGRRDPAQKKVGNGESPWLSSFFPSPSLSPVSLEISFPPPPSSISYTNRSPAKATFSTQQQQQPSFPPPGREGGTKSRESWRRRGAKKHP